MQRAWKTKGFQRNSLAIKPLMFWKSLFFWVVWGIKLKGEKVRGKVNKTHPAPRRSLRPRQLANPRGSILLTGNSLGTLNRLPRCWTRPSCCRVIPSLNSWGAWSHFSVFMLLTLGFSSPHPPNSAGSFLQQEHPDRPQATWRPSLNRSGGSMLTEGGRWQPKPPQWPMPSARTDWLCCESCVASGATQTQGHPQSFWWRLEMNPRKRQGRGRKV